MSKLQKKKKKSHLTQVCSLKWQKDLQCYVFQMRKCYWWNAGNFQVLFLYLVWQLIIQWEHFIESLFFEVLQVEKRKELSKYPFLCTVSLSRGVIFIDRVGELLQVYIAVSLGKKSLKDLNQWAYFLSTLYPNWKFPNKSSWLPTSHCCVLSHIDVLVS